jgi:AcrR family transcriptional regulator
MRTERSTPKTSSRPRPDASGYRVPRTDRRGDILEAAERLFAAQGYSAVSIRDIATEARVPLALVRYYFGRKEELFAFLFERRRAEIDERIARISSVSGATGPARARRIIRAWAGPVLHARAKETGNTFAILVARSIWEAGAENRRIVERFYDPLAQRFIAAMRDALPDADETAIVWAYGWALGALLTFIADTRVERLSDKTRTADPARGEQLIAFMSAGFLAAVRKPTG